MLAASRHLALALATLSLPLLLNTCKGSTEPARLPTNIVITPPSATLSAIGATQQFTAVVEDQHGDTLRTATVSWTPSSAAVVTVSSTGLVTAVANGTAQVTATLGTATQSVSVTVAQAAAQLAKPSGDGQTGIVGQALARPLVVQANDANRHPAVAVTVTFAAAAGSGSVGSASAITDANGQAQTTWTLGSGVGAQTATASVTGGAVSPVSFTATAKALATVLAVAGNNLPGLVGYVVNVRPTVRVTDTTGTPVAGRGVTFALASGGGSITGASATTNGGGYAQAGSWLLGGSPGANTLTATVSGVGVANNPVTFTATGLAAAYTIAIQGFGPPFPSAVQTALDSAVAKWQRIVYRPVGAIPVNVPAGTCGNGTPAINQTVTDLLILARFDSVDGPGKILGQAGPCLIRNSNMLTVVGTMMFDTADVASLIANGALNSVILHEMGHVIGFGALWDPSLFDCLQLPTTSSWAIQDTYYSCFRGRAAFDSIGGITYTGGNKVPVENCGPSSPSGCGPGTVNVHWREPVFGNELMTGYLNTGTNPLSVVSAAAMEDLGYTVNYAGADAYTRTFTAPVVGGGPLVHMGDDVYRGPIYVVDHVGRVVGVLRR